MCLSLKIYHYYVCYTFFTTAKLGFTLKLRGEGLGTSTVAHGFWGDCGLVESRVILQLEA